MYDSISIDLYYGMVYLFYSRIKIDLFTKPGILEMESVNSWVTKWSFVATVHFEHSLSNKLWRINSIALQVSLY